MWLLCGILFFINHLIVRFIHNYFEGSYLGPVPRFSDLCAELWLLCLPRKVRLTFPRRVYTTSTIWRILSRFTAIAVSSETRSTLAQKSNLTFLRRPTLVRPLRAHARIHHIVRVFCLQSFTGRVKCLSFSALWMKAKGKFAFTAGETLPFLEVKTLVLLCADFEAFAQDGEGSEGKMQGYCVVCSARAREERERFVVRERSGFSSEVDEFISEPVETTSEVGGTLSEDRC